MAMFSSSFTGSDDLVKNLSALSLELREDAVIETLIDAGQPMRADMERGAPKGPDAPHLSEHILVKKLSRVDGFTLGPGEAAVGIGPAKSFFYGTFWEFGWKFHRTPHPFVRPAYETGKDRALTAIGRGLWDRITGRGRSTTSGLL
jgi:HK97 gp10 family phage protein